MGRYDYLDLVAFGRPRFALARVLEAQTRIISGTACKRNAHAAAAAASVSIWVCGFPSSTTGRCCVGEMFSSTNSSAGSFSVSVSAGSSSWIRELDAIGDVVEASPVAASASCVAVLELSTMHCTDEEVDKDADEIADNVGVTERAMDVVDA